MFSCPHWWGIGGVLVGYRCGKKHKPFSKINGKILPYGISMYCFPPAKRDTSLTSTLWAQSLVHKWMDIFCSGVLAYSGYIQRITWPVLSGNTAAQQTIVLSGSWREVIPVTWTLRSVSSSMRMSRSRKLLLAPLSIRPNAFSFRAFLIKRLDTL